MCMSLKVNFIDIHKSNFLQLYLLNLLDMLNFMPIVYTRGDRKVRFFFWYREKNGIQVNCVMFILK